MSFNHFRLKRKAHKLSRSSTDQSWNVFHHFSWGRDSPRNPEERDLEALTTTESPSQIPEEDQNAKHSPSSEGDTELRQRKPPNTQAGEGSSKGKDIEMNGRDEKKKQEKESGWLKQIEPKEPFTLGNQLQRTFLSSWINIFILAAPAGIGLYFGGGDKINGIIIFIVNFIAIIPLAAMLSFATEEIALRTGETLGGLLNATFGNAVELIVAIIALVGKKFQIVQTSLVGSILSNLLLVMGCCFFFGGLRRQEQFFNTTVAQTAASLLALAAASVIVPTVFDVSSSTPPNDYGDIAKLSRGTSVILLIVYAAYLYFQLHTHQAVFNQESEKVAARPWRDSVGHVGIKQGLASAGAIGAGAHSTDANQNEHLRDMVKNPHPAVDEDDEEEPQLHIWVAFATLAGSTAIIALCAEAMVNSIDAIVSKGGSGGVSEEFVGLILLPIVGNAAEHATAVTVAIKDKMDLAIGVAVGSSMQVALFLIPLLVVIGWGLGYDQMNLSFDIFQVAVMFVAVLLTNYLIGDGKSHWLEGFLLITLYAIIAVCSFWYPNQDE